MRDYAKLSPFFWTRGSGKRLRGDAVAQVVAAYLTTCPSANLIGLFYVPIVTIAHETGLTEDQTRDALVRIATAGYAFYDEETEVAWVPNLAKFEIGVELKLGDKRRGKVIYELERAGLHRFAAEFYRVYGEAYQLGACPFDAPSMPLRCPFDAPSMGHPDPESSSEAPSMGHPRSSGQSNPIQSNPPPIHLQEPFVESADGPVLVLEAPETASREAKNRKKPETPCPASDALPDAVAEWARRWAIPTEHAEFSNFLLHAQTNDRRCRDWKAAWARWTINAPRFAPRAGANGARHVQSAENRSWKLPPEAP